MLPITPRRQLAPASIGLEPMLSPLGGKQKDRTPRALRDAPGVRTPFATLGGAFHVFPSSGSSSPGGAAAERVVSPPLSRRGRVAPLPAPDDESAGRRGIEPRCQLLESRLIPDHNPRPRHPALHLPTHDRASVLWSAGVSSSARSVCRTNLRPGGRPWCRPLVVGLRAALACGLRQGGRSRTCVNQFPKLAGNHYPTPCKNTVNTL